MAEEQKLRKRKKRECVKGSRKLGSKIGKKETKEPINGGKRENVIVQVVLY